MMFLILYPMKNKISFIAIILLCAIGTANAQNQFRVGVAGLNHDHIYNILNAYSKGQVNIVGIAEPNKALWAKYGKQFHLPDSLFFEDLKTMVTRRKPAIVLGYNTV